LRPGATWYCNLPPEALLKSVWSSPQHPAHEKTAFWLTALLLPVLSAAGAEWLTIKPFESTGCADCHRPQMPTVDGGTIAPYTDLLLHDLGAELADRTIAGEAVPSLWRTPPLWGLSTAQEGARVLRLMHDGRARSVDEAIDWHGGSAADARRRYEKLTPAQRQMLVEWVGRCRSFNDHKHPVLAYTCPYIRRTRMKRRFEWDDKKAASNLGKHGVSFEEATLAFGDPLALSRLERIEHGEERWQTIGFGHHFLLLLVVHTLHMEDADGQYTEIIRIISARRANKREKTLYEHG